MSLTPEERRTKLLSTAHRLVADGVHLFPCDAQKRPLTSNGFKTATTNLTTIEHWLKKNPLCMLAARTGEISGFFVVDLDRDVAKGLDGTRWLAELQQVFGPLPAHPIARTPRGGQHHYFKYPHDRIVKCSAGRITHGVDVRGDGGYVIVPPSASSVGEYSWEVEPWQVPNVA